MKVALMIEGQNGLNWSRWQRIVEAVEALGFYGLYRSDHFTDTEPPDLDSLELWVSLTWLASHTKRLEFGPLVSPVSFRHPTMTARMAAAVDDLSGGRLQLGLGAGWLEREHTNFGWQLGDIPTRFARFEEGLQVITSLLRSDSPVDFDGRFFRLHEAILLPRPSRSGGPPILIGGNGPKRTFPLVARFADEWNAVYVDAAEFSRLNSLLDETLESFGRPPSEVHRSLMTGCIFVRNESELPDKAKKWWNSDSSVEELRQYGVIMGTSSQIVDHLGQLAEAGVQKIMLQWLDVDDLDGLERMAKSVLDQVQTA